MTLFDLTSRFIRGKKSSFLSVGHFLREKNEHVMFAAMF